MIQFNLLPDVKKEYVKAKRTKRLIISMSTLFSAGAVGVTVLMFTFVHVAQKQHVKSLTNHIEELTTGIQSTEDIDTILTVQNQLSFLAGLHESKSEASRIFQYMQHVSPSTVRFTTLDVDTLTTTMQIAGSADSIATVNKLVDNIKAAKYAVVGLDNESLAYSEVKTQVTGDNEGSQFMIYFSYDPVIFDNTQEVVMRPFPGQEQGEGDQ